MKLGTAMLIRFQDGGIVGLHDYKGRGIILPGGKLEEGETYREAAIRECMEEARIKIAPQHAHLVFHAQSTDKSYCFTYRPSFINPNQVIDVVGQDFGSGKVGIFKVEEFMKGKYRAYYDALFQHQGFIE